MRDFKGMKRQRGRNRGNKPQQHNANRAFESNGPDGVKIRGAAQHVFEKYQQLARDAASSGDRVLAENYQQHAEHYFRLIRTVQPNRPASEILGRDQFASGFDIDFEEEPSAEAQEQPEAESDGEARQDRFEGRQREDRFERNRDRDRNFNRDRDDRQRDDRNRDDRPREDRGEGRFERNRDRDRNFRDRDDRPRDGQPREDRFRDRDDRQRDDRQRDDRPREERGEGRYRDRDRGERRDRNAEPADPMAVVEPQAAPLVSSQSSEGSPVLRSEDGGVSQAPAFLQQREPRAEAADEAKPRAPRRRRAPKSFEGETGTPQSDEG